VKSKQSLLLTETDGRRAWLEVEVKDDPRDARGKIFLFYDVRQSDG